MSMYARERRRRIREFNRIYSKDSISVDGWQLWQVHAVPEKIEENDEIDFWCSNGKDVILTTLRNSKPFLKEIRTQPRSGPRVFIGFKFRKLEQKELKQLVSDLNSGKVRKKQAKR